MAANSTVIDVTIGLFFIYLLLSLACSTISEWIARILGLRARNLEQAVAQLLANNSSLITAFWQHHLVASATQEGKTPSYLPARTFATVLLDAIAHGALAADTASVRATLAKVAIPGVRTALLALFDDAKGSAVEFQRNVETWFNDTMDRVSGWYKRQSQLILGALAFAIAIGFNVDSVQIVKRLCVDANLRSALVNKADSYLATQSRSSPTEQGSSSEKGASTQQLTPAPADGAAAGVPAAQRPQADSRASSPSPPTLTVGQLRTELEGASVLVGWDTKTFRDSSGTEWFWRVVGWFLTALAISLGAPFWFDLLSKVSNLRAAGTKPLKDTRT